MARILGVDYGERRIGFAVSDPLECMALPLSIVTVEGDRQTIEAIRRVAAEVGAERIVIGLPLNMNGSSGPMAQKVSTFALALQVAIGLPVVTADERLSTALVERSLLEGDMSRQKRKGLRDKLAAQVILQGYLDLEEHKRLRASAAAAPSSSTDEDWDEEVERPA
jgi:putative Holliday junction resolvase